MLRRSRAVLHKIISIPVAAIQKQNLNITFKNDTTFIRKTINVELLCGLSQSTVALPQGAAVRCGRGAGGASGDRSPQITSF